MQPLLSAYQIKQVDAYTIANKPISSLDLMERAAKEFVTCFSNRYPDDAKTIAIYCGTGNNGGDGFAIARLLTEIGYKYITVKIARFSNSVTDDFDKNLKRLKDTGLMVTELTDAEKLPAEIADIIIDGLLGSGLNKPLSGSYKKLVEYLNSLKRTVIAIDIPTGFFADGVIAENATVLNAALVISFQQPKLNFLLPESGRYISDFAVVDIGIAKEFLQLENSPYQLLEVKDITDLLKPRKQFTHKGTYGHALIIAGQQETMGAALLCSSACVHTGAGLTTACIPQSGLTALNAQLPEVMALIREEKTTLNINFDGFTAVAIGPGLGKQDDALVLLKNTFICFKNPVVIDADALNLLGDYKELLQNIPAGSILTPHMKEFDRLFGDHDSWWKRIQTLKVKAAEHQINIVLKNSYTIIGTPDGMVYFNPTGNPAMASGGMGDVLTGIIVALLAQQYTSTQACLLGVYLHGLAGDELAMPHKLWTVLAGAVAAHVPVVMAKIKT